MELEKIAKTSFSEKVETAAKAAFVFTVYAITSVTEPLPGIYRNGLKKTIKEIKGNFINFNCEIYRLLKKSYYEED